MYMLDVFSKIRTGKRNNMNDFVFPILDNDEFKSIDEKNDFSKLTEQQYKSIKHATIVYNRNLKKLQQACLIHTHLSSHVARHSFTNLLLTMKDVNLYDISQSLGHSSIAITQNYINNGFSREKVDYLNREFSKIYRRPL
jgi:integrase